MSPLLLEIEAFLAAHNMSESRFGQAALSDKQFIKQLRGGRDIRLSTLQRVRQFMLTYREAA